MGQAVLSVQAVIQIKDVRKLCRIVTCNSARPFFLDLPMVRDLYHEVVVGLGAYVGKLVTAIRLQHPLVNLGRPILGVSEPERLRQRYVEHR